jgi:SsrA-binding protein
MHISPYEQGNRFNHDPLRKRKLLLNRSEIAKMVGKVQQQGMTLIPLKIYLKQGLPRSNSVYARAKRLTNKREDIAKRDAKRQMERDLRDRSKG